MDLLTDAGWELAGAEPGTVAAPAGLGGLRWTPVRLPATVAGALRDAGAPVPDSAAVDGTDWWLRTTVSGHGRHLLQFDGLATVADVWLAGQHVLHGESMFRRHQVEVTLPGRTELVVRCAAPLTGLGQRPRPRWKSTLVPEQRWRWLRTTVLGRTGSASPQAGPVAPAGIWRPARLVPLDAPVVAGQRLAASLTDDGAAVDVELDVRGPARAVAVCAGTGRARLTRDPDGLWRARVHAGEVQLWWPHGYGPQPRYPVTVAIDDGPPRPLGEVAFRTVAARTDAGRFTLVVNGVEVFARGAVWQPLDPVGLGDDPTATRTALGLLRDAGHTMVRVPGTGVYETDDFYAACDELGLLLWQDCMVTTLDPPDTPDFAAELAAEVRELADRLAGRACVAVVCGGAETEQQPALLGLPALPLPALTDTVPGVLADRLPGVPYVTSTPSGGALPVHVGAGVAQYFGVGAYLRPVTDARAAGVRFAAEALAFSVPPEADSLLAMFGSPRVAGHHPRWKAAVPRDRSAGWDFEDVRDHYVGEIFGVDPRLVRYADPERYLDLGRAAVCTAMSEVLGWWRRPRSGCGGALVLSARDLCPGAGWGLVDAGGRPKAPWYALRPVLAPTALLVGDDGGDGLTVTAVHDGPEPLAATLELTTYSPAGAPLDAAAVPVKVDRHAAAEVSVDAALGRFTDANHYYRFGPRSRDAMHARLVCADGVERARVTALLGHHLRPPAVVAARVAAAAGGWQLQLTAERAVQWLAIDAGAHRPRDSWFHLAPGERRTVALDGPAAPPQVTVRALNVPERTVGGVS